MSKNLCSQVFFSSDETQKHLDSDGGYICWSDLHAVYDKDVALQGNLKAPKLTYSALHPGNNTQNIPLALTIFDDTTIAAFKSYFSECKNVADFLTLINSWWTVVNARTQFNSNLLATAPVYGDGKAVFLRFFANWLEKWSGTSSNTFSFSKQTSNALVHLACPTFPNH